MPGISEESIGRRGAMKAISLMACMAVSWAIPVAWSQPEKSKAAKAPLAEEIEVGSSPSRGPADTGKFEELKFEKSLVIEAKVERPQVQFPLLKEPPPEKPIPFEISFREELLRHPRENTFVPPKSAK